jgi:DNA repair protein RadC
MSEEPNGTYLAAVRTIYRLTLEMAKLRKVRDAQIQRLYQRPSTARVQNLYAVLRRLQRYAQRRRQLLEQLRDSTQAAESLLRELRAVEQTAGAEPDSAAESVSDVH